MKIKTTKTAITVFIGTMLLVALAVTPVLAQPADGGPNDGGPRPMAFRGAPDRPPMMGMERGGMMGRMGQKGMMGRMGKQMREGREDMMGKMLLSPMARQHLGLTDDQVAQIRKLNYDFEKQGIKLEADKNLAHLDLEQLMSADEPDRKAINDQLETIGKIETQQRQLDVNRNLDLREVLTKEQREKIGKFREQMMEQRMEERMDRPNGDRQGRADRRQEIRENRPGRGGPEGLQGRHENGQRPIRNAPAQETPPTPPAPPAHQ